MTNPENYHYVIQATEEIVSLLKSGDIPDKETMLKAIETAHRTLGSLLQDPDFARDLQRVTAPGFVAAAEWDELRQDLQMFIEKFLQQEDVALRQAGLSEYAVKQLLYSETMFWRTLEQGVPDPKRVLEVIARLRDDMREGEKAIRKSADRVQSFKRFRKWAYRFGGLTVVVVDVSAAAPTAAVAVASVSIGGAIMAWND